MASTNTTYLEKISTDLNAIKEEMSTNTIRVSSANISSSIRSLLLVEPLKQALHCIICHDVVRVAPLSISLCCKQVIACGNCTPHLINTDTCPHCRADNFRTINFPVFDSVIDVLAGIVLWLRNVYVFCLVIKIFHFTTL